MRSQKRADYLKQMAITHGGDEELISMLSDLIFHANVGQIPDNAAILMMESLLRDAGIPVDTQNKDQEK